jgi:hypothetical protein
LTNATDGRPLVNRLEEVAPVEPRLAPPVVIIAPAPTPAPVRRRLTPTRVLVVLVLVGVGLRAGELLNGRCLWIDESMLALNLIERTPQRLLEPLDWNQGAPVGFLLLAKSAILAFGPSELGLRLVPFLGSVLGVVLFAWVSRRLLPAPAALLATGLFAVSPYLISYAAECKQYATDAAITTGLFAVSAGLLRARSSPSPLAGEGGSRSESGEGNETEDVPSPLTPLPQGERGTAWSWASLAAAGAAAVWFSHPATFVLGGIGTALLAQGLVARSRSRFITAALVIGCWLVSFGLCYLLCLRQLGANQYLLDYWNGHFLPLPPRSVGDLAWLLDHFFTFFAFPAGLGGTAVRAGGIAAALFVVGVVGFWRERWPVAVAVVVPAGLTLLASGLHKYPFAGRLLLFLVPIAVLGVARGGWMVVEAVRPRLRVVAWVLLGVLVAAPAIEAYQEIRKPARAEQLESVLEEVRCEWQAGDRMYVYYGAEPAFRYYTRDAAFPADAVVLGTEARANRTEYREQLTRFRGQRRVWLVFSHRHQNEELVIRVYAEGMGRCVRTINAPGAAAYLFDFSVLPDGAEQAGTAVPPHGEQVGAVRAGRVDER